MDEPKELWVFNMRVPKVIGPLEITGETEHGNYWYYRLDDNIFTYRKDKAIHTKKQAIEECYRYHMQIIKQEQAALNEKKRLINEFYEEVLFG